ncbi:MAG TPA: chemotaxis protein CheW [Solirubrobacteraceae bacterium]|nr:chemotaxis protein CheW [Solirubrobacteraceae bacterium]
MAAADAERQVVVFSLRGEYYGLPITAVREIIRYVQPGATATARGAIQGMIILRGRTLPIADLSSRLGKELEIGTRTRILVLEVAGGALGLIVDGVDGILPIPADRIEPLPVATVDEGLGDEIAAVGERLIVLIDPERTFGDLLPRKPARTSARRRKTTSARPRASS